MGEGKIVRVAQFGGGIHYMQNVHQGLSHFNEGVGKGD